MAKGIRKQDPGLIFGPKIDENEWRIQQIEKLHFLLEIDNELSFHIPRTLTGILQRLLEKN